MAYNPTQIHPDDLNPLKVIGVDLPFSSDTVFRPTYQTKDAIKNNLINYLLTEPGERVGNPQFGIGIRSYIFEQMDNVLMGDLEDNIESQINNEFPQVNIDNIKITSNPDINIISIDLNFSVKNTNIQEQIQINIQP